MEFGNEFLDKTPNEQGLKETQRNFIKLSFKIKKKKASKDTIKKVARLPTKWEKNICKSCI